MLMLFKIAIGYAVAVAVAVFVALLVMDSLGPDFLGIFGLGYSITFPSALPGFLLVILVAAMNGWSHAAYFAVAGALNVFPAMLFFGLYSGDSLIGLSPMCCPGGLAGGLIYWAIAVRSAARPSAAEMQS